MIKKLRIQKFADIFSKHPDFLKIRKAASDGEVLEKFYEIFKGYEQIAVPRKVVRGVLYIEVENAAWRNELKFRDEEIAVKINEFFGDSRIKKVVLTN